MQKLRNVFMVMAHLLTGMATLPEAVALAQTPEYTASNSEQAPDFCQNANQVEPLLITIENDTDVDLNTIVPRSYGSYVRSSSNGEPVGVSNNSGQPVFVPRDETPEIEDQVPLSERLCFEDIKAMEDQTLYAHEKYTFQIRRAGFPAHLFIKFRIDPQEPYGEYEVARWEYAEKGGFANATCDVEASRLRFTIGCAGNNNINFPIMNINLGHTSRPLVPQPLIEGAEPGEGPPSTP